MGKLVAGLLSLAFWSLAAGAAHETELHFVKFSDGAWNDEQISAHLEETKTVYAQCGLEFTKVTVEESSLNSSNLIRWEPYAEKGYLNFGIKAADGRTHPLILLIDGFADAEGTPFALAPFIPSIGEPTPPVLMNSVFFPAFVNSDAYKKEREKSPYSSLAHELLHIFTLDGQHNNDPEPNLLSIWRRRNNRITEEQCEAVRKSPLVRPRKVPNSVLTAKNRSVHRL